VFFGCFKIPKFPVLIFKQNNRNKRLVLDSAETSFSSSFGCFGMKLVSEDTLDVILYTLYTGWQTIFIYTFSVYISTQNTFLKISFKRCSESKVLEEC
jgi:hypothetical protein